MVSSLHQVYYNGCSHYELLLYYAVDCRTSYGSLSEQRACEVGGVLAGSGGPVCVTEVLDCRGPQVNRSWSKGNVMLTQLTCLLNHSLAHTGNAGVP